MAILPASLTLRDAAAAVDALRRDCEATAGEPVWRIDAAPLDQLDTSAIAVLLECQRIAAARKRTVELVGASRRLIDLARLYGVEALIGAPVAAGDA